MIWIKEKLSVFIGTGPAYILRQTTITVKNNKECGASSDNMLCAGDEAPDLHDSCQVKFQMNLNDD